MTENIASRVRRLVSGTTNMLVDAVEKMAPEVVMEEAIREVDQAIEDVRAELGKLISKQHMATRRLADANRKHEELAANIELAIREDREDLAEAAVAQLIDIEAQIPILEATIAEARDGKIELEGYISALQARKREMRDELAQFREAQAVADTPAAAAGGEVSGGGGSVESGVRRAESAFERALEGAGGVAAASSAPDREAAAKHAELDELARKNRIRERLESFKTKGD